MKLAEALIERADLQRRIEMIRARLMHNAKVQEGTDPSEKPADLLKELNEAVSRLEYLIVRINRTNELTKTADGKTIAELLAHKDVLAQKISVLGSFLDSGNSLVSRVTHAEIRILPAFDIKKVQKEVDGLSQELRLTDTKLQEQNWLTDLIEQ